MIVVDTDVMVDVLRSYEPATQWMASLADEIVIPGFVVMELIAGCRDLSEQRRVERMIRPFPVTWPSQETLDAALALFARHRLRHGISMLDSIIGQTACDLGLPLASFNQKHYSAIADLKTLQPYSRT